MGLYTSKLEHSNVVAFQITPEPEKLLKIAEWCNGQLFMSFKHGELEIEKNKPFMLVGGKEAGIGDYIVSIPTKRNTFLILDMKMFNQIFKEGEKDAQ